MVQFIYIRLNFLVFSVTSHITRLPPPATLCHKALTPWSLTYFMDSRLQSQMIVDIVSIHRRNEPFCCSMHLKSLFADSFIYSWIRHRHRHHQSKKSNIIHRLCIYICWLTSTNCSPTRHQINELNIIVWSRIYSQSYTLTFQVLLTVMNGDFALYGLSCTFKYY